MELHCKAGRITDQFWQVYNAILAGLQCNPARFTLQEMSFQCAKGHLSCYEKPSFAIRKVCFFNGALLKG